MKQTVIGIDVGGSTTKIVGFQFEKNKKNCMFTTHCWNINI